MGHRVLATLFLAVAALAAAARAADDCTLVEFGGEVGCAIVKHKNWFLPKANNSGGVLLLPRTAGGFDEAASSFFNRASDGVPGTPTANEELGGAFVAGDLDGDGHSDYVASAQGKLLHGEVGGAWEELPLAVTALARSAAARRVYAATADGKVHVLDGATGALREIDVLTLPAAASAAAVAGAATAPAAGVVLAVGRRNADAFEDLVVGVPAQTVSGKANAGAVYEFLGSSTGLRHTPSRVYRRGLNKVPGTPRASEGFGAQVELIDFDHKGFDNLFIGVPDGYSKTGVFYAEKADRTFFAQTLAGGAAPGTFFGWAIARLNLDGDAYPDFAVGAPGWKSGAVENAGAVYLYRGGPGAPVYAGVLVVAAPLGQTTPLGFGASLEGMDVLHAGTDQILVGAPCFDLPGKKDAGALVPVTLTALYAPIHLDRGVIAGAAAANDYLGSANGSQFLDTRARVADLCAGR